MVPTVEQIVQALDDSDRRTQELGRRVEYSRERSQKWIQLGDARVARGQHDKAKRAYQRALELQPSLIIRLIPKDILPDEQPTQPHPFDVEFETNWQRYGFVDPRESSHYTMWIFMSGMREEKPKNQSGYRGLKTPEEILRRYPLDKFREQLIEDAKVANEYFLKKG